MESAPASSSSPHLGRAKEHVLHPACCLRFVSDWTQPLDILAQIVNLCVITYQQKGALTTQSLEQMLDSECLLCKLGAWVVWRLHNDSKRCGRYPKIEEKVIWLG